MSELLNPKRITLHSGDEQYIYDFDEITIEQLNSAVVLFNQYGEMLSSPPKNIEQTITGGMIDLPIRALAYVVTRATEDGEPSEFRREGVSATLKFLRSMKSKEYKKVQEIKSDFFSRVGIVDVESMLQFKPMLAAAGLMTSAQITPQHVHASNASANSSDSTDSTTATNTDGE
ncbi:MAG: hypothetical protein JNL32_03765 [Candidatus Kapabacteria bacterium]|nr:hypothetical protein [Candidatus Kapabacteria bacterium]